MKIFDTMKAWADLELKSINRDGKSIKINERIIIRWYFFGSCDVCSQAMDLDDKDFMTLYRQTLKYIGVPKEEIEETISIWMLDKISQQEIFIINEGAHHFANFKGDITKSGGLKACFVKLSDKLKA
ncbi:MAG: hypothetical protein CMG00_08300 [Candidatus Marinimicrobia bacterium]|nr:hypothetical protein [Candidatus Neomarinimicrobiota bacterium]|tara:strand:- start:1273 stop:1653 length:381 start_codon:yes stop_codon:yes gene_type:complete